MTAPAMSEHRATPDPRRWWALAVIGLAQLMVVLDMTIVNIALPSAQHALGMSDANRQWVITAYTLAFGGLLLLGGRLSDLFGRKRSFITGLIGFAGASAIGGAATSSGMLFGARALQGVFAALLAPAALALLTTTFTDPRERGKAFGVFGAIAGGGGAIGMLAGGALTQYLSWRWCLYVNVPVAIAAVIGATSLLHDRPGDRARSRLDIPGVILGCGGLLAVVYGFSEAEPRGWSDALVLALLAGGAALLAAFVLWQTRTRTPLLPLHIVRDRQRAGALISMALVAVGMFGSFLFLTYYLQGVLHWSPLKTGLAYLPMTGAIIIGSTQISARLLTRVPPRWLAGPGMTMAAIGLALLTRLNIHSGYAGTVLPAILVLGLGMGCTFMAVISTATGSVAPQDSGVTSAALNSTQQVGGSLGTALLNTIAASATTSWIAARAAGIRTPAQRGLLAARGTVHGFHVATWWGVGALLLGALTVILLVNAPAPGRAAPDGAADTGREPAQDEAVTA
ncbi:MFS transporter [Mangrovactinospora gilvigrisea]|uniref:MFS transporter n=1 Tax=Mangrovactinospora gilvigrisea TaxID=1428644 RepID=A0A1J7C1G8_9ACTN|nr:MFS transporter [Mangrovactinospora gilvigrisea]OIV35420.1 MFS transporter [Mangrovactinospora gilvigrisea]